MLRRKLIEWLGGVTQDELNRRLTLALDNDIRMHDAIRELIASRADQLQAVLRLQLQHIEHLDEEARNRDRILWGAIRTLAAATPGGHNAIAGLRADDVFMSAEDHAAAAQGGRARLELK